MAKPCVMIIEDVHYLRESMVAFFAASGFDVMAFRCHEDAADYLADNPAATMAERYAKKLPDVIVSDYYTLPSGMNGANFIRDGHARGIAVVACSDQEGSNKEMQEAGAVAVFDKWQFGDEISHDSYAAQQLLDIVKRARGETRVMARL